MTSPSEKPLKKQWLKGPYTFEEITERVGQQWLPVRRFCVEQKGKLRPIDDFCENRLNSTFTTVDKITLKTMDHIVWAALIVFQALPSHQRDAICFEEMEKNLLDRSMTIGGAAVGCVLQRLT